MSAVLATIEEAVDRLIEAAWTVTDSESSDFNRTLVHSRGTFVGCDWDLDAAVVRVREADQVAWVDDIFGHELLTVLEGRRIYFDVKAPAGVLR